MIANVIRISRISEVVEEKEDFVKTPTHKIKRFLYNRKNVSDVPAPEGKTETKKTSLR